MESDTPRTDALVEEGGLRDDADFVRQLERELAAAIKQRDEAHGLIRNWQTYFIRVINDSSLAYVPYVPVATYVMNEADKRAFLAATRKEGGGA